MTKTRVDFINKYGAIAMFLSGITKIKPQVLLSQAIVESQGKDNKGNWIVGNSGLSKQANNYFGIKCHTSWKGKKIIKKTREEDRNGKSYYENACFRKYNNVIESIIDHAVFLNSNSRYKNSGVFSAKDYKEQIYALKRGGYATSKSYVDTLLSVSGGVNDLLTKLPKKLSKTEKIDLFNAIKTLINSYSKDSKQYNVLKKYINDFELKIGLSKTDKFKSKVKKIYQNKTTKIVLISLVSTITLVGGIALYKKIINK